MRIKFISRNSEQENTVPFFSLVTENDWFNNPADIWQLAVRLCTVQPDQNLLKSRLTIADPIPHTPGHTTALLCHMLPKKNRVQYYYP